MAKFLKKHARLFLIVYLVVIASIFILGCGFMTQYKDIMVNYSVTDNVFEINSTGDSSNFRGDNGTNQYIFQWFNSSQNDSGLGKMDNVSFDYDNNIKSGEDSLAYKVYQYRESLNSFNNQLIVYGMISLICVALLFIFMNHSRRIYYKSNLLVGLVSPFIIIGYSVYLIIQNIGNQAGFSENYTLFNLVSLLRDRELGTQLVNNANANSSYLANSFNVTDLTFNLTTAFLSLVIVCSVLIVLYTLFRYKSCKKERTEIINKAVDNND